MEAGVRLWEEPPHAGGVVGIGLPVRGEARELAARPGGFGSLAVAGGHISILGAAQVIEAQTGRRFERDRESGRTVRSEFLTRWAKTRRKLDR